MLNGRLVVVGVFCIGWDWGFVVSLSIFPSFIHFFFFCFFALCQAGAEGLMVFDSHGGQLSPAMYKVSIIFIFINFSFSSLSFSFLSQEFSLPFLKDIVKRVKEGIKNRWEELKVERRAAREERKKKEQEKKEEDKQENDDDKMQIDEEQQQREKEQEEYEEGECPFVPMGVFSKGSHYALEMLSESGYDIVGLDWTIDPSEAVKRTGNKVFFSFLFFSFLFFSFFFSVFLSDFVFIFIYFFQTGVPSRKLGPLCFVRSPWSCS